MLKDLRAYSVHKALGSRRDPALDITTLDFDPPSPLERNGLPLLTKPVIQDTYLPLFWRKRTRPMPEFSNQSRRANLLLVSNDIVDTKMAGPGIRYVEMARALSDSLDVTLAVPNETQLQVPNVRIVTYQDDRPESLQVLVENHEQTLISGYMVFKFPFLKITRTRLIVDWYDPFYLENYYYYLDLPLDEQIDHNYNAIAMVNDLARIGDFFICGNDRQRDLWIGILSANLRVNPLTLKDDETLRKLIDVVGVGIPDRPLKPKAHFAWGAARICRRQPDCAVGRGHLELARSAHPGESLEKGGASLPKGPTGFPGDPASQPQGAAATKSSTG